MFINSLQDSGDKHATILRCSLLDFAMHCFAQGVAIGIEMEKAG